MSQPVSRTLAAPTVPLKRHSQTQVALRRFWRDKQALTGALIIGTLMLLAIFAPFISGYDPLHQDYSAVLQNPSKSHPMGTDDLGRDTFSRLVYGARLTLLAAFIPVALALCIGVPVGMATGYFGGIWDQWLVMRVVDAMQAFPSLILALAMAAVLGGGFVNAMLAIGIGYLPAFIRISRAQTLAVKNLEYVHAARATGAHDLRVMFCHVLPNIASTLFVQTTLAMATAIIAEAGLSYLGLGARPEQPSWGSMLHVAQGYLNTQPWLAFWPGLAISSVVLGFNLLGDGLRRAIDPKLKR